VSRAKEQVDGRTLRHQHRRPELLAAAVEYILERGIADLSLRPCAKELGVSHATLLRHFGTKEALITEVVNRIRTDLLDQLVRSSGGRVGDTPARAMWAAWRQLCEPSERRQFVLLFELVAMQARDPDRFGSLAPMLITDFLGPIQASLRSYGLTASQARDLATGFLAQVRGLQLDLAVSGEQRRVDAAMRRYIKTVTAPAPQ
jgi:AcrR family transcriptional regulator